MSYANERIHIEIESLIVGLTRAIDELERARADCQNEMICSRFNAAQNILRVMRDDTREREFLFAKGDLTCQDRITSDQPGIR